MCRTAQVSPGRGDSETDHRAALALSELTGRQPSVSGLETFDDVPGVETPGYS
jgi:hypothetical protein